MIVIDGTTYAARPSPSFSSCGGCAADGNGALCKALPDCMVGSKSVVFVEVGKAQTPQQIYNSVMQEDNV